MPLRLVEIVLPDEYSESVRELLDDTPVLQFWSAGSEAGIVAFRVLLDARNVESLSDALADKFGSDDGFRLVSLPVEATVPAPESEEEEHAENGVAADDLEPERISREELYEDVTQASRLTPVFAVMVGISTVVAAVGLIRDDIAILIGAMVIAPLLGPNVSMALACTLGDLGLAKRSLKANGVGVAIAAGLSLLIGVVLGVDPETPSVAARTYASLGDVVLALAAGAAGTLAFTGGVPAVVVGVMVAVALLPPLVVAGLLAGAGYGVAAAEALVLLLVNVTCVSLAAVATFLIQKVRPRTWWEAERAKEATRVAVATWIIMLALLVGLILHGDIRGT